MDEKKQTIRVDLSGSFAAMAETVLREWTQDEPSSEQCLILGDTVSWVTQELWDGFQPKMKALEIREEHRKILWNAVVLVAWNHVSADIFSSRFSVATKEET